MTELRLLLSSIQFTAEELIAGAHHLWQGSWGASSSVADLARLEQRVYLSASALPAEVAEAIVSEDTSSLPRHENQEAQWSETEPADSIRERPAANSAASNNNRAGLLDGTSAEARTFLQPEPLATPLSFEANQGQTGEQVDFLARGDGYSVFFTDGDAILRLKGQSDHVVRLNLLGSNPESVASGLRPLNGTSNYLVGDREDWLTGIENYSGVQYESVYDGIDVQYYGNRRQLEYDFVVAAGADAGLIKIDFSGTESIQIDEAGKLVLTLNAEGNEIDFMAPYTYQEVNGQRQAVNSQYVIHEDGTVGFELGSYDKSLELVIDPILDYATFIGGTGYDTVEGIAADSSGNVFITGWTESAAFPTTVGALNPTFGGGSYDIYIAKLSPDGSTLQYSTFIGGTGNDTANSISVDGSGNVYVTGNTTSSDFSTVNAFQNTLNGMSDAVLVKLNSSGNTLLYSTYFGGVADETSYDLVVDAAGFVHVGGWTKSADLPLQSAYDGTLGGTQDGFVARFDTSRSGAGSLVYSSYFGGGVADEVRSVDVDGSGNVYVSGLTTSTDLANNNAYQNSSGGGNDAFVTQFSSDGGSVLYSTYLGGSSTDYAEAIAVDDIGNVYVGGRTDGVFPTTAGAFDTMAGGSADGFVSKIDPKLSGAASLIYSTYLGGTAFDYVIGLDVDVNGVAYIGGFTGSSAFPTTIDGNDRVMTGTNDGFFASLDATGSNLTYSTFIGGTGQDRALDVKWNASTGAAYVGGNVGAQDGPTSPTPTSFGVAGGDDGFAAKFTFINNVAPVVTIPGAPLSYIENDGVVVVDATATTSDADSTDFDTGQLTVDFTSNGTIHDRLAIRDQGAGIGNIVVMGSNIAYDNGSLIVIGTFTGGGDGGDPLVVTFNAAATPSRVQAVIRNVTFENVSENPSELARTVRFVLTDGDNGTSNAATQTITVIADNDDPYNAGSLPSTPTVVEDTPGYIDLSTIDFVDVDAGNNLIQVTLTTTTGGRLTAASDFDVMVFGSGSGTLTLRGGVSDLNNFFSSAFRFQYSHGTTHMAGADADSITITVNDLGNMGSGGSTNINIGTVNIDITPKNDAPLLTAGTVSHLTANEDSGLNSLGLSGLAYGHGGGADEIGQTLSYSVTVIPAISAGDILLANSTPRVTTGSYTLDEIRGMQFQPADNWAGTTGFQFNVTDSGGTVNGGSDSISQFILITVDPVNDVPLVDLNGTDESQADFAGTFTEDGGPVVVSDVDAVVSDVDSTSVQGLSISISGAPGGASELFAIGGHIFTYGVSEVVSRTVGGTTFELDFDGTGFSITREFGGLIPTADLALLVRGMTYENASQNPAGGNRTMQFVAIDDLGAAGSATTSVVTVVGVNDTPTFTSFAAVIDTTNRDTEVELTLAELKAQGDEADVDGSVTAFAVSGIRSGTLRIGANGAVATNWAAETNDTIDATNHAYWTPDLGVIGTQDAFYAVAKDDLNAESTTAVTAQVEVIDMAAPVVTVDTVITNDSTPQLSGTVDDNSASISVTVDSINYAATNNGDGTWTLADNTIAPLFDGVYDVLVTATAGASNVGSDASSNELTVDTVVATPNLSLTNDTGSSNSDLITSDSTVTLANIESGATVQYSINGGTTWIASFTAVEGSNAVEVRQTDVAGNVSVVGTQTFTLDTSVPVAPVISLINDTGASNNDQITSDGTLTSANIEAGAAVEYSVDGGATWTASITTAEGANIIYVRQTDVAGNTSAIGMLNFTLDTTIATLGPVLTNDTGSRNSDLITGDGTLTLDNLEAGSTVDYSIDVGTTWTGSFTAVEGVNAVGIRQTDAAGNVSAVATLTFTLDVTVVAPGLSLTNDTGTSNGDLITSDGMLTLASIESGSTVEYSVDGGTTWTSSFTAAEGSNNVQVRQTDIAGNESAVGTLSFTLDTTTNSPPTAMGDGDYNVSQQGTISNESPGVLANDSDSDGDNLSAVLVANVGHGTLALSADGSFVYTPDPGFVGLDQFQYAVFDGQAFSAPVTVDINVQPAAPAPGANRTDDGSTDGPSDSGKKEGGTENVPASSSMASRLNATSMEASNTGAVGTLGPSTRVSQGGRVAVPFTFLADSSSTPIATLALSHSDDDMYALAVRTFRGLAQSPSPANPFSVISDVALTLTFGHNELAEQLFHWDNEITTADLVIGTTAIVSSTLSVGYVVWLLRSGVLLTSFLSSIPAWCSFDPLPIVESFEEAKAASPRNEESLTSIVDRLSGPREAHVH